MFAIWACIMISAYASAAGFTMISAEDLKKALDSGKEITVVDARTEREFRDGHIPNAINIPPDKVREIAKHLPKNGDAQIVFYCRRAG
jgi:rhodanese-related sulfurtransferase